MLNKYFESRDVVVDNIVDRAEILRNTALDRFSKSPLVSSLGGDGKLEIKSSISLLKRSYYLYEKAIIELEKDLVMLTKQQPTKTEGSE